MYCFKNKFISIKLIDQKKRKQTLESDERLLLHLLKEGIVKGNKLQGTIYVWHVVLDEHSIRLECQFDENLPLSSGYFLA